MTRVSFAIGIMAGTALLAGCVTMPEPRPPRPAQPADAALPAYRDLAARYNQRIEGLPRLWARTVGRIWYPDEDGRIRTEQVEGHVQYMAPDRLLLTFDKVGQTYGLMGSNEERYWWMELERERKAHIGEHARVTPQRIDELNLPIYPRDVIDLLGITPLPLESPMTSITWTADRRAWIVSTPARGLGSTDELSEAAGLRRTVVDPQTFEPIRIEILDAQGQLRVASSLSRYETVSVPGGGPEVPRPRVATEVNVVTADDRTQMRLRASEPEVSTRRPREAVFDLDHLLSAYRVREIISLDEPRAGAAQRE
jgi:outer membrane lipoprotein-sorting protein